MSSYMLLYVFGVKVKKNMKEDFCTNFEFLFKKKLLSKSAKKFESLSSTLTNAPMMHADAHITGKHHSIVFV